jgi:hypothetical protein
VAWSVSPSLLDFCRRSSGWHIEPQSRDSPPSFLDLSAPFLGPLSSFVESRCRTFRRQALCIHRYHSEHLLASLVLVPKTIAHNFPAPTYLHISCLWNGVRFAHQSLCNPKISTLLKAVRKVFLKGCPNLSEKLILKYLNPSPATSKGHMKRPRHGIRSTRRDGIAPPIAPAPLPIVPLPGVPTHSANVPLDPGLNIPPDQWIQLPADIAILHPNHSGPALIADDRLLLRSICRPTIGSRL